MHLLKKYDCDTEKDSLKLLKQQKIFNELINERCDEILELKKKIDYDDLMYHFKGKNICFNYVFSFLKKIGDGDITLEKAKKKKKKKNQNECTSDLNEIKGGGWHV